MLKALTFFFLLNPSFMALAKPTNPLLGKWRWNSVDCKNPDYIFTKNKLTVRSDVDGQEVVFDFKKVKYSVEKDVVHVDFGQPHGLAGAISETKMSFKMKSPDHFVMDRKPALNDLHRCK